MLSQATNLSNNQWHTVVLTLRPDPHGVNSTITELSVDGVLDSTVTAEFSAPILANGDSLFLGGVSNYFGVVISEGFRGCINNVNVNGR